jgi:hypothetical protein
MEPTTVKVDHLTDRDLVTCITAGIRQSDAYVWIADHILAHDGDTEYALKKLQDSRSLLGLLAVYAAELDSRLTAMEARPRS